ncbi:MAG: class I SAM-dependent methyltransferase [Rhodobiaceae bacterium]|nr:class I SAM-dependent methyltransferase [Rhodobiaceae bacterium]
MSAPDAAIAAHYATGSLYERILAGLDALGIAADAAGPEDLHPVDEFHSAGIEATNLLFDDLPLRPGETALDIGSGIGGTARKLAHRYGAHMTGVDLTEDYVATARRLSDLVGLSQLTAFQVGSGTDLNFAGGTFDLVLMLHVGMNIEDKARLFAEAARVLKPGGQFAVYDIMDAGGAADIGFPVPWARDGSMSFVDTPQAYRDAALAAGLAARSETDRTAMVRDYFARVLDKMAKAGGPPPLGIHLLMGETAGQKIRNYVSALNAGHLATVEMVFGKPD